MNTAITISDSLITSLCREIDFIRYRYKRINESLSFCKNNLVKKRLLEEINNLNARRIELVDISSEMQKSLSPSTAKLFLYELCKRPLDFSI
ncbi:pilus assembly protein [Prochlorococcus marinus]|uniref:pilus assembly protein n=1 Tax=Prochlorococcus marinus TaxID=1219 RepID=UPI0022B4C17B|nr:pilus assembly protein [Prochlorococcus marinus]